MAGESRKHNLTVKFSRAYSVYDEQSKRKDDLDWIQETFQKRECILYVAEEHEENRCKCGRKREDHVPGTTEPTDGREWTPNSHTSIGRTNAYGEVEFQGVLTTTRAKYLRLSYDTDAEDALQLITDVWNLKLPKLLIEVTGGAKDFHLHPKLCRLFRKSIVKVAATTGAWILTGGTNTGVMKHVGEALRDHARRSRNKIVAIGIAPWGIVENRESLVDDQGTVVGNKAKSYRVTNSCECEGAPLDPNHSHFMLVDNGTTNKFGVEIMFRSKLEKLISQQSLYPGSDQTVPIVCLVLEGGINTIKVVLQNVSQNPPIPIVVVEGSGRAADLIAFALSNSSSNGTLSNDMEEELMKKIVSVFSQHPDKHEDLLRDISDIAYRQNLVTIYNSEAAENEDIDHSILIALLKASNLQSSSQLKLALIWNRVDIAKEAIFTGSKSWHLKELEAALELALMKNRVDFVKLLLEHVCVKGFLTTSRLERLYNSTDDDTFTTFSVFMTKRFPTESKTGQAKLSLYQVGLVLEQLIRNGFRSTYTLSNEQQAGKEQTSCCQKKDMYADHIDCSSSNIASPLTDLFLWAVLTCRYDMAYLLWQRGIESLAKSIVAFHLNTSMATIARERYNSDAANALEKQAEFYRLKSIDLLTQSFEEDQLYTRLLLCTELKNWSSMTCLSMAARFHHIGFIAHPAVQFLLNDQWYGIFRFTGSLKGLVCWFCCCSTAPEEESNTIMNNSYAHSTRQTVSRRWSYAAEARKSRRKQSIAPSNSSLRWRRQSLVPGGAFPDALAYPAYEKLLMVITAPVVIFWLNALFFFAFLVLFSYVVMTQMYSKISIYEWIVVATVVSLTTEEIRQMCTAGDSEGLSFSKKLKRWSSDSWNLVDFMGVVFFFAGFMARTIDQGDVPFWGRVFYSIDIVIWYLRVLDILSVKNFMGPYVNMVGRMMWDTVTFTVLLFVFMTAYGVASRAILHPNKPITIDSVEEIFSYPYWQIFGELFMDEILPDCETDTHFHGKQCETAYGIVLLIMAVYLLIANVLLLNLLIAIFNNTFSKVIENANEIWKFHRYELIMEYSERPCLPPPLTLIMHVSMIMRRLVYACCNVKAKEHTMKIELDDDATQLLRTFEDECIENYLRQQTLHEQASLAGIVQRTSDRMDVNVSHLEQLQSSEADTRRRLKMLGEHVDHVASLLYEIRQTLKGDQENNPAAAAAANYTNSDVSAPAKSRLISNVIGFGKSK